MNKPSLKAYLDLIQGLLSCPKGEEWILLRQHKELVNLGLVEVMEQVASHLAMEGKTKAAKYLHNWAGKLHHILIESVPLNKDNNDKTNAYAELIQALLSCQGLEPEILAAHQDLIGPELVTVMNQIASQMAEKDRETANYLHNLAADLNRTWIEHHQFEPTFKQEIAPDPWLDEDSLPPDSAIEATSDNSEIIAHQETEQSQLLFSQPQIKQDEGLLQLLTKIADSLVKLETTIALGQQPANPLWYMYVLEKAEAANWILTTDEIEQLIGVKPHCHHDETSYVRGSWMFIKAKKVGAQAGWRVQKKNTVTVNAQIK
ncbi:MAG TPA: hypothetical protein V6C71_04015 [Coleofasciculaceae cyanobacterium]|jgi:hypothetical protein